MAPAIIQPAGLFLDVVGEQLRARTYVFTDPDGAELCLRPISPCRPAGCISRAIPSATCPRATATTAPPSATSRAGTPVPTRASSARLGIESFAAADREQDDAAVLGLTVEALRAAGLSDFKVRIGDLGLFAALLGALEMPQRWRRRLRHQFWRPDAFRAELARLSLAEALKVSDLPRELITKLHDAGPDEAATLVRRI